MGKDALGFALSRAAPARGRASGGGNARVLGAAVAVAIAAGLLVGSATLASSPHALPSNAFVTFTEAPDALAHRVAYVGYDPTTFDPRADYDRARVEDALARWRADHWSALVTRLVPVESDGFLIGYRVTYVAQQATPPGALADDLPADGSIAPATHALDGAL